MAMNPFDNGVLPNLSENASDADPDSSRVRGKKSAKEMLVEKRNFYFLERPDDAQRLESFLLEVKDHLCKGWIFGIDKIINKIPKEEIESDNFQNAVKIGILKSLLDLHPQNALEIKRKLLVGKTSLDELEVKEAAERAYDVFLAHGQLEIAKNIRAEFPF
ncbi:hypothetical protein KKG46_01955 [Patescibacteria group bacterium]|nr:hypothetical protein [Patescibacteria group bacterium]